MGIKTLADQIGAISLGQGAGAKVDIGEEVDRPLQNQNSGAIEEQNPAGKCTQPHRISASRSHIKGQESSQLLTQPTAKSIVSQQIPDLIL